jgi:hypothetical protein
MPDAPEPPAWPAPGPMPFAVLLDEAMRRARRHVRTIYLPLALAIAAVNVVVATVQALWLGPEGMSSTDPWQSIARSCSFVVVSLPLTVVSLLLHSAMIVAAVDAVDAVAGRGVSLRRALRFVVLREVLGTQLLVGVCVLAAALCCVLPVFYVGPLLSLTLPAMAAEGLTGSAALSRSAELTRHNPQRRFLTSPLVKILALFLVVTVISYLVNLVLILPATVTHGLSVVRKMAAGEDLQKSLSGFLWWQVPLVCLSSFTTSAVYVYASFALALLFFDLRARRDGDDLRLAIAGMAGTAPGNLESSEPPPPLPPLAPPPLVPPPGGGGFGGAWPDRPAAPEGQAGPEIPGKPWQEP